MLNLGARCAACLCMFVLFTVNHTVRGETNAFFFPSVNYIYVDPDDGVAFDDVTPFANFFVSARGEHLKFLTELVFTEPDLEVEVVQRLMFGWGVVSTSTLWFGRFHSPIDYWNMEFHHGGYLQTSASRPAFTNFESAGGPMPLHLTGLLWEGEQYLSDQHGIYFAFSLGAGPERDGRLKAVDVLALGEGRHDVGAFARIGYRPDIERPTEYGLAFGTVTIPDRSDTIDKIDLVTLGGYLNLELERARIISEIKYVANKIDLINTDADQKGHFVNFYVQGEQRISEMFTLYARAEDTFSDSGDPYLTFFPRLPLTRLVGGIRIDFLRNAAITFELSRNKYLSGESSLILIKLCGIIP